jgi:putative ABC transport system substrate-binding protein
MIRRRDFLAGMALAAMASRAGRAQRLRRVGVLTPGPAQWEPETVLEELRQRGYRVGETLQMEVLSADNALDRLPELAARLAAADVDAVLAINTPAARAMIAATATKPIVVGIVADPIGLGLVSNLARPGGNVTGVSNMAGELAPKRFEIFKEAVPGIRRIVTHYHPDEPISRPQIESLDAIAARFAVEFKHDAVRTPDEVERSVREASVWRADAVMRLAGQGLTLGASAIDLALRSRLPTMVLTPVDVRAGGLLSYFADLSALWRRAADLVHRVLTGTPPGELPFERPAKFELAINLRTAQALGLSIPPDLVARADVVID